MRGWLRFAGALLVGPIGCACLYGCTNEGDGASESPTDKNDPPAAASSDPGSHPSADAAVILGSAKAKQLVVGSYHACALLEDGTVRCWGYSGEGEIGNGHALGNNVSDSLIFDVPVAVPNLRDVKAISSMDRFTCALTDQGGVKCWGQDELGQLGTGVPYTDNRPHMSSVPLDVKGLGSGVASIAAGYDSVNRPGFLGGSNS